MTIKISGGDDGITKAKLIEIHANMYLKSSTYREMVDLINNNGTHVSIFIGNIGTNPTTYGDPAKVNIAIQPNFLAHADYWTNWDNDTFEIQSLERVLAHVVNPHFRVHPLSYNSAALAA